MAVAKKDTGAITLTRLEESSISIPIEGTTPYIPHKWSEKMKGSLPGHPGKTATVKTKIAKNPTDLAEESTYRLPDGKPGIPASAFKAAMVSACRFFDKPSMTEAKILFWTVGEGPEDLVPIEGEETVREDVARIGTAGTADLRYRHQYANWRTVVTVRFLATSITAESIIALLDAAGRVGVGEWRPGSKSSFTGTYGQFRVALNEEVSDGR